MIVVLRGRLLTTGPCCHSLQTQTDVLLYLAISDAVEFTVHDREGMFMQFQGGGIGYEATRDRDAFLRREGRVRGGWRKQRCDGGTGRRLDDDDEASRISEHEGEPNDE